MSLSITAILMVVLVRIFGGATDVWSRTEGKVERNRTGRLLSEMLGRELGAAMLPVEGAAVVGTPNLQFLVNPPLNNVPQEYRNPDCLFWQAPVATETSMGEIAEVGYFVKWELQGDGAVASLRRFFVNPTTLNPVTRVQEANADFLIYKDLNHWLSPALLAKVSPADKASGYAGLVAEHVVGFWVRCYGEDGNEITTTAGGAIRAASFDSRRGYDFHPVSAPSTTVTRLLPRRVAVSLAQLDPRHADLLGAAWQKVRTIANAPGTLDAGAFMRAFQQSAASDPDLQRVLPGLRIYESTVVLDNAR